MFRLIYLTFHGKERMDDAHREHHLHESPKTMTVPLMVLAVLSVIGGFVGIPHMFGVDQLLRGVARAGDGIGERPWSSDDAGIRPAARRYRAELDPDVGFGRWLVCGDLFARYVSTETTAGRHRSGERLSASAQILVNKYYVDEIYGAVIVRPIVYFSVFLWKIVDVIIIDGSLNGSGRGLARMSPTRSATVSRGGVRGYATVFVVGVVVHARLTLVLR